MLQRMHVVCTNSTEHKVAPHVSCCVLLYLYTTCLIVLYDNDSLRVCIHWTCTVFLAVQRSRLEKEVMSREGPALAQLVMALLHPDRFKRPSATRAMRLPLFTEEPQEDVQTGGEHCSHV